MTRIRIVWYDERGRELDRVVAEPGDGSKIAIPILAEHCRVSLLREEEP